MTATNRAMAASRSLQEVDRCVDTAVQSMLNQIKAEYRRELCKFMEAVGQEQDGLPAAVPSPEEPGSEPSPYLPAMSIGLAGSEAGAAAPSPINKDAKPTELREVADATTSYDLPGGVLEGTLKTESVREACTSPQTTKAAMHLPGGVLEGALKTESVREACTSPQTTKAAMHVRRVSSSSAPARASTTSYDMLEANMDWKRSKSSKSNTSKAAAIKVTARHNRHTDPFKLTERDEQMLKALRQAELDKQLGVHAAYVQSKVESNAWRQSISQWSYEGASQTRRFALNIITRRSFDFFIGLVITANAVTIGVETSHTVHGDPIPSFFLLIEYLFLAVYILELALCFCALGVATALQSRWVTFDTVLVVAGILNVLMLSFDVQDSVLGNINMLKLLRLLRLARTVRVFVQFRTLWLLTQGLMCAAGPMFWTCVIMCIVIYVFAVIGMETITDDSARPEYGVAAAKFDTMWNSMMTLSQFMFMDSASAIYRPLISDRPALSFYFTAFVMIGPIALMAIVTAIMVESSLRLAHKDNDAKKAWDKLLRKEMMPKLRELFCNLDRNGDGEVDLEELYESDENIQEKLQRIIELDEMQEIFHMLDVDGSGTIDIEEFIEGIMRSQADKPSELIVLVRQGRVVLNLLHQIKDVITADRSGRLGASSSI